MRFELARDLDLVRRGWHWGEPRPRSWPPAAPAVPAHLDRIGWARSAPVRWVRRLLQEGLSLPFTEVMAHPRVEGREWVSDLERPVILASNHVSHADTQLLLHALPRTTRERTVVAAAADYWYRRPWLGRLVSLWLNTFPFSRAGGPQAVLHDSARLLRSGWHLLVYPEGTRSEDGRLREFKPGVGFLATETRTPVVPLHVAGSHRIMPKGRPVPLPAPARVRIGKPLLPQPGESSRAFTERVHAAVQRLGSGSRESQVVGSWVERWRAAGPTRRLPAAGDGR